MISSRPKSQWKIEKDPSETYIRAQGSVSSSAYYLIKSLEAVYKEYDMFCEMETLNFAKHIIFLLNLKSLSF